MKLKVPNVYRVTPVTSDVAEYEMILREKVSNICSFSRKLKIYRVFVYQDDF